MALFATCDTDGVTVMESRVVTCSFCGEDHCEFHIVKHITKHTEKMDHLRAAGFKLGVLR